MTNRMSKWLLGVLVMLLMLGSAVAMAAEWIRPWMGDPMSVKVTGALAAETAISIDDTTQVLCYTFTPTENDVYRIYSTGAEDSYMYLYDDRFALMAEDDDTGIDTNFSVCCNMKRGRTYYCYFTAYPNGGVEASYRVFVRKAPRTDDGLGYRISDGVMTIVGYVGAKPNPVIPKTITTEGRAYPVKSIGIEAFLQAEITGVTIPEGVRYIDDRCFAGCTKLQKIVMPDSVNQMGKELFDGCSMLGEVVMSKNVMEIGPNTFRGCSALNSVTIYQNVTTIDASAFANVPANVTIRGYTGSYAETFAKGKSYPFESIGTTAVETMELNRVHSAPVTGITTFRFVPKEKGAYTVTVSDLGAYNNRVEVLGSNGRMLADTFSYNQGGNSLSAELTANTTYYIRCTLFDYGQGTEKYSVTLSKEKTVDGYAYRVLTQGTESEASIMLYAGSEEHLTIPNTLGGYQVKTIAGGAFSSSAVLSVKTPENLRNIEGGAFAGCKSLKTVDLSASTRLSGVDHQTFRDCTALSEILFPDSIELIGSRAFFNCTALTSVTLPADLTSIYGQAFGNCTGMTAVTIPKGIVFIHIWAFDNHASELVISGYSGSCAETFATDNHIPFKALGTVVIPPLVLGETSHVAVTERKTFSFTPSTTGSYTLSVGSGAYSPTLSLYDGAWKLLSSGSKLSFKLIAGNPYYYACTLPTYDQASPDTYPITLRKAPGTEDGYEYEIAYNKATIIGYTGTATALVIPEAITDGGTVYQVTRIESYAFENGTFTSVTLPAQLSVINGGAFEGCKELRDIVIPDRLQRIYGFAFSGCTQLAKVEMSQWTMLIGDWAFQGCQNLTIHAPTDSYAHSYATRNGIRFASSGAMDVTPLVPDQDYDITFNKATARKLFSFMPTETGLFTLRRQMKAGTSSLRMKLYDAAYNVILDDLYHSPQRLEAGKTYYYYAEDVTTESKYTFRLEKANLVKGYSYVIENNGAVINGYFGVDSALSIPNTVNHDGRSLPVLEIEDNAFSNSAILSVKTPENLRYIGWYAFRGCKSLKTVDLSASTQLGGVNAETFYYCTALSEISLPDNVNYIGWGAFFNCKALTSVVLPANLTSISEQAFANCTGMTAVTIPRTVMDINAGAFDNHAPRLVISGYRGSCAEKFATDNHITFNDLGAVVITPIKPSTMLYVAVTDQQTFSFTPSTTGIYILSVGSGAYSPKLSLYDDAWKLLSSGQELSFKLTAGSPYYYTCTLPTYDQTSLDRYPLTLCKVLSTADGYEYGIVKDDGGYDDGASIIGYTGTAVALDIPEAITEEGGVYRVRRIGSCAFKNGTFTSATLPSKLQHINAKAFEGCKSLKSIVIPDSVQSISRSAFSGCTQLAKVEMSQWMMDINDGAFQGCQNLTIHAPTDSYAHSYATRNGIQFASSGAMYVTPFVLDQDYAVPFDEAKARKLFSFTPTETRRFTLGCYADINDYYSMEGTLYDAAYNVISNDLFGYPQWLEAGKKYYYCTGAATEKATYTFRLEKANLMNGYSYDIMNGYATITGYFGTDSVLSIPNTVYHAGNGLPVENIERSAFSRQDMTGVTIPANVSRISAGAFSGCTKLQSIVLPDTVHYINDRAFSGCSALTRAKLSEECTRIADGLFAGCTSLKEIKIPSGVTNIGWEAFAGCVELKKVIIPSSVTRIQADAFKNCQALTIYGFTGSSAETYAQQKGIPFVPLTAGKKGDINEDGVVDREDAELLMRELCQLVTLTDAQKALAEVVNDGVLNNKDVVDILRTPAA